MEKIEVNYFCNEGELLKSNEIYENKELYYIFK